MGDSKLTGLDLFPYINYEGMNKAANKKDPLPEDADKRMYLHRFCHQKAGVADGTWLKDWKTSCHAQWSVIKSETVKWWGAGPGITLQEHFKTGFEPTPGVFTLNVVHSPVDCRGGDECAGLPLQINPNAEKFAKKQCELNPKFKPLARKLWGAREWNA